MLPGNIFGLILKNKMTARDVYSILNNDFCWPPRAKGREGVKSVSDKKSDKVIIYMIKFCKN